MKFMKFTAAIAISCAMLGGNALAQQMQYPASVRPIEYESGYYNLGMQEDTVPSPSDQVAVEEGLGCEANCSDCGDGCEPWRLFGDCCRLNNNGIVVGGFLAAGVTANSETPASRFNGPVTFNDRNEAMVNQLWIHMEKEANGDCGWGMGGRIDFVWGTDARYTQAAGLEDNWSSQRFYQMAMPQLYAEFANGNLSVKVGHFFTIIGYEVVPAVDAANFFYSHAYTMQYGEPFTHTGALASYEYSDQWTFHAGYTNGWDAFEDVNNAGSFLGGVTWTSCDGDTSLALALTSGDESNFAGTDTSNRTMYSVVLQRKINDRMSYIFQHDNGWQIDHLGAGADAEWYGINQYLFYTINDCWAAGVRFEWFRDDDGVRVTGQPSGNPIAGDTFVGDFYELALGLNYTPCANLRVRPELRWDWFNGVGTTAGPYDDGADDEQFLAAVDFIYIY